MKAYLKNYRQSPRKVRLLADMIKGKSVDRALVLLSHTNKRATDSLGKLIRSAVSNAKDRGLAERKDLFIKSIRIDDGVTIRRSLPRAHGRATPINKRTSNISILLEAKSRTQNAKRKTQSTQPKIKNN